MGGARNVIGREELVCALIANLLSGSQSGPRVVVGDTGAGKTSLLLGLAATIAHKHDVLPIVLSLRNVTKERLDFQALAHERFEEYIDPHIRAKDDVDKLWRWLCKRRKLVVLADDLDRADLPPKDEDPYGTVVRAALEAARRRELPLVVTSRPHGVPRCLPEPPVELGRLELDAQAAAGNVVAPVGGESKQGLVDVVRRTIEAGQLLDSPFYLGVVRDLQEAGKLREPLAGERHAVRVALLDAFYEQLIGDQVVEHERERRIRLLDALSIFAAETLAATDGADGLARATREAAYALQALEPSDVVYLDEDGLYRFGHEVLHSYFAARALVAGCARLESLNRVADSPRTQLALVLAAAKTQAPDDFCVEACALLLRQTAGHDDEGRLLRAVAAAEVATAGRYGGLDTEIAEVCVETRADASPITRRAAVASLANLGGKRAVEVIWDYAGDSDYDVRWAATQALLRRCSRAKEGRPLVSGADAFAVISNVMKGALSDANKSLETKAEPDDWDPIIVPLKHMAWMLPALQTAMGRGGDPSSSKSVGDQLDDLLRLEAQGVTPQRGLEASIAQGFKVDARLHRNAPIDQRVLDRLDRPCKDTFWYSQVNLLHALTLRAAHGYDAQAQAKLHTFSRGEGYHPFVRATATLCQRALDEISVRQHSDVDAWIDRYVWDDEGVVV